MKSSAMKNCHCWRLYPPPHMNWRNGNKPPFSSIITYPLPECYTQFHTNISNAKLMFELQIRLLRFFTTIIGLHPTVVFTDARDNTVQSQSTCHLHTSSTLNGMVIDSANGQNGLVPVLIR